MEKRNLEKVVILGVLAACISVPVFAADLTGDFKVSGTGDAAGLNFDYNEQYKNIDITLSGTTGNRTTLLLGIKNDRNVEISGGDTISIINTAKSSYYGGIASNNDALFAMGGSNVELNADNVYIAAIGSKGLMNDNAISAKNTNHSSEGDNSVEISGGVVQIIGDLDFSGSTKPGKDSITLNLTSNNSFWYGDAKGINSENIAIINLSNGAEWIYDQNSTISQVTLNNGGIINLQDEDIKDKYQNTVVKNGDEEYQLSDYRSGAVHKKVTIEELKGTGGIFKADIDWATNQGVKKETANSDYIYINKVDESAKESVQILDFDAAKANLDKMDIDDKLYFATVKNGETKFTTKYGDSWTNSEATNVYDYNYGVGSDAGDWYIELADKNSTSNANVKTAVGAMYAGYALGTELDSFNKRLGEARYLENNQGLWVRYRHAKTGWDNTYKTDSDMIQIGIDNNLVEKDGKHYRGVAIDYTTADTSLTGAISEGENERYAVSFYDTWLGEKGHYRDVVIRGGRINNDYDVKDLFSDGYRNIGSDYHQNFGSISVEWGRTHNMENGWYFEPQTQVQLARVDGADYLTDSGIKVNQKGATSLIGFLGFRLGREYQHAESDRYNSYYLRAGLMHEFIGDKEITLTGSDGSIHKEYDGTDTWFNVGIGADISIAKNSYFWADVEKTFGSDWDNTWQINGGLRWEW